MGTAFLDSDSVTGTTLNLTSGQLKVATNGITDNEIADNSVTYAKIQDVAASSVIGNTTASAATPTNVAILDEDNMASDSAISLATQQSIKAYVDNQIASDVFKYSTGWQNSIGSVTVADGSTHTITHNLGTTDVVVNVYVNSSASDINAQQIHSNIHNSGGTQFDCGALVTSLSSNSLELQLGENGYNDITSSGVLITTSLASKYLKVVVIG